jgi:hypothetical protein
VDEAGANFEQAQLIRDARVRMRVPVAAMCEALDLSRQSVNTYRNVAERIDEKLFRDLIEARRPGGLALFPWSIIAQVARLAGKEEREDLIKKIRLHGWRTRNVEGYVSVERSDAAARIAKESGGGRNHAQAGRAPTAVQGTPGRSDAEQREEVLPVVGKLATRMEMLLKDVSRKAPPTLILVAVADAASRMIAEVAGDADGERATVREMCAARDALTRCAAVVSYARTSIEKRLSETEQHSRSGALASVRLSEDREPAPLTSRVDLDEKRAVAEGRELGAGTQLDQPVSGV